MNAIKEIVLGFCASALFLGIMLAISADGATQKTVRYALSVIFLASLLASFSGKKISLPSVSVSARQDSAIAAAQIAAESYSAAVLSDNGIDFRKVEAKVNKNASEDIYISKITVYSAAEPEKAEQVIRATIQAKTVEVLNE